MSKSSLVRIRIASGRSRSILTALGFGAGLVGAALISAPPASAQSAADITVLAGPCANCHGTDGRSPGPIASIAGRPEAALLAQLKAFKSEAPPAGTTVMNRLAKGYTDEQLGALAKHFASISTSAAAAAKPATKPATKRAK